MPLLTLISESLDKYITHSGTVNLYHYSNIDQDTLVLDPKHFGKKIFSKAEKRVSSFERLFFYLDPNQRERFFRNRNYNLYVTEVKPNTIYNLRKDPLNLLQTIRDENNGVLNFDQLFERITDSGYENMYYRVHNRDIVVRFYPIEVSKSVRSD